MALVEPDRLLPGTVLVVAPHMDDEVLGCGATLARLPQKDRLYVAYATDGSRSPVPMFEQRAVASPELAAIRKREAIGALGCLGVPRVNLTFLDFPDGRLSHHTDELCQALYQLIHNLEPAHLFIPFRFDRHPDHLALNRAVMRAISAGFDGIDVFEYFVYYRWRLLPGGDVRQFLRPAQMVAVDTAPVAAQKRQALDCFQSQTTRYFSWQTRPILTATSLEVACTTPELFLQQDGAFPGATVFPRLQYWIAVAHYLEPRLKNGKELVKAFLQVYMRKDASS